MIFTQPKEAIAGFVNARQGCDPTTPWGHFTAIGLVRSNQMVAGVIYNNRDAENVCMHVGAVDGKKWLNKELLFAAFDYPFNELKCARVTACVRSKNKKAKAFVKKLGFKYEGKFRRYYKDDDMLVYGMLKDECRHLEKRP